MTRHPNSARFHELLTEIGELHDRKQADYGRGDDPFANVRSSEDWNVPAWVGAMIRLNDKVRRLQSLAAGSALQNEGAYDSFLDIAVYALIAYVLYEQEDTSAGSRLAMKASDTLAGHDALRARLDELRADLLKADLPVYGTSHMATPDIEGRDCS